MSVWYKFMIKKKYIFIILLLSSIIASFCFFVACDNKENDDEKSALREPATLIGIAGGEVEGKNILISVDENT